MSYYTFLSKCLLLVVISFVCNNISNAQNIISKNKVIEISLLDFNHLHQDNGIFYNSKYTFPSNIAVYSILRNWKAKKSRYNITIESKNISKINVYNHNIYTQSMNTFNEKNKFFVQESFVGDLLQLGFKAIATEDFD